jgi:hypothetical protein
VTVRGTRPLAESPSRAKFCEDEPIAARAVGDSRVAEVVRTLLANCLHARARQWRSSRSSSARPELEQALARYERKRDLVMAERVRAQLAAAA